MAKGKPLAILINNNIRINSELIHYFFIRYSAERACAVKPSAEGVDFSGFRVKTKTNGSQDAISTSGDFTKINRIAGCSSKSKGILHASWNTSIQC